MIDFGELEISSEELEQITQEMSIFSGYELGAIKTVLPSTVMNSPVKYNETFPFAEMLDNNGSARKANQYGFFDIPAPLPKKYHTH